MRLRRTCALLSVAAFVSAAAVVSVAGFVAVAVVAPSPAFAAEEDDDTGEAVELEEWTSEDGCSVLAAPAAVAPALLSLLVVGRRRRQND